MPIENFEHRPGGLDPADVFSAAQTVAAQLVTTGQAPNADADTVDWLIDLVDDVGLDTMAEMWANAPAVTFGGALWRLYALHQATNRHADQWAECGRLRWRSRSAGRRGVYTLCSRPPTAMVNNGPRGIGPVTMPMHHGLSRVQPSHHKLAIENISVPKSSEEGIVVILRWL